jgi:hypothetical protein
VEELARVGFHRHGAAPLTLSENNCPTLLRTIAGPPVIFIYQGTFVRLGFGVEGV